MKKVLLAAIISTLSVPVYAGSEELNVYSARKTHLIKPLLDKFSNTYDIKVNLVASKADALLKKLEVEGKNTSADVLITTDAGRLHRAKNAGVLQAAITDKMNAKVPAHLQDPENYWLALTTRARVIVYAKDRVNPSSLSSYDDLTDSKWQGKICIRSSNNIYNQSLVASMIAHNGEESAEKWAEGLVENLARKPKGGDRDQIKAVAAGQCDIAVVNTYYLGVMINGKDKAQQEAASKVAVFWPNQNANGTHINISGIAVTKHAKNKDNAQKLINFLLSDESQKWYAEVNNEYPTVKGIALSKTLKSWGKFKADDLGLYNLGLYNNRAVKLMDKAGWR